jgi:hypothetical protein
MASQWRRALQSLIYVVGVWLAGCGSSHADAGSESDGTPTTSANGAASGSAGVESDATAPPVDMYDGGGTTPDAPVDDATSDDAAAAPVHVAPPSPLFVADAAPAKAASDCKPGTYTGTFSMSVDRGTTKTGVNLKGTLSIALVANSPTPHPGEFNSGTLTVAPGALFSGKDNFGDVWSAEISGQLDCGSRMFVGSLTHGTAKVFGIDAASLVLDGSLSATYDPSANPVALENGAIELSSPDVPKLTGTGEWSATLQ